MVVNMVTYNCKNIKRSVEGIKELCMVGDIIALQETWLLPCELSYLTGIHDEFGSTGTSAVKIDAGILKGRPFGGVALLWRKSLFPYVSVIPCSCPRIAGIRISTNDKPIIVLSVYMPVDCADNLPEFTDCLGEISAIIDENDVENVFILGDFNAHPGERFYNELLRYSEEQDLVCADVNKLCLTDTFSFISDAHGSRRWLDHCIVTKAAWLCVENTYVKYDVYWSDHFPLIVQCNLNGIKQKTMLNTAYISNKIIWKDRTVAQIEEYKSFCDSHLKDIVNLIECTKLRCSDENHKNIINNLYKQIVNILGQAASVTYVGKVYSRKKVVYGWNKHVSESHWNAKLKFSNWVCHGKPPNGSVYEEMKLARKIFKGKLKWCQNHQDQIKMDSLAKYHAGADFKNFWKCTRNLNVKPIAPVSVADASSPAEIAKLFKEQFSIKSPLGPSSQISFSVSAEDIKYALKKMKKGKSPGHDGLSVEHLRYAGSHLNQILALLFNMCVNHAYLPPDLLKTIVVPIVKNRTGDVSDKGNYRPISLATIIAKVFDSVISNYIDKHVMLHDAQFGFRPDLSTDLAILSLKHTVKYYVDRETPVYACFLDLSKAFDLVSYDLLWQKLKDKDLPVELIELIRSWYLGQENEVRWGSELSDPYRLECGVRQGGLSSPLLFSIYVDDLIEKLSSLQVGCSIDGACINNISYADDMVLLAPSVAALRKMLAVCETYALSHGLVYNVKKTEYMVFKAGAKCPLFVPPLLLNGTPINRVKEFKYLGHWVTEVQDDNVDMDRERRALSVRANMLARRFARCTETVKITLFKAYCTSLYSASLWFKYTQRAYNALRVQYNNSLRVLLRRPRFCSASAMFAEAHIDGFDALWRKKTASLLGRLRGSSNSILKGIADKFDCPLIWSFIKRTKSVLVINY
ncbi:hypothetical protein K1T71_013760 [Dendrolimus kikuchii]|uniref:Uncharacterized protein n=1 Tax=Dendrolimus kikuchii TaxID=765133 RepID=A0ACC1CHC3_9NEOP|nr:hypothetical protein K1T71_013760 [Dendrolimus kikuchii]